MGYTIFIQEKRVCVRPLHNRLEAIQRLKPPTTVKGCRSFAGMVSLLSIFCLDLQKLLTPIYDLAGRDRQFIWREVQQSAFDEIKNRLQKPPVLHLPNGKGRFHLSQILVSILWGVLCTKVTITVFQGIQDCYIVEY